MADRNVYASTLEGLCDQFQEFCNRHQLPQLSADEILIELYQEEPRRKDLCEQVRRFIDRWDAVCDAERVEVGYRFRLSRPALVRFRVWGRSLGRGGSAWPTPRRGRFQVRGRRGLNRMRFTGHLRGRALARGTYLLEAVATDRAGRMSPPAAVRFRTIAGRGARP